MLMTVVLAVVLLWRFSPCDASDCEEVLIFDMLSTRNDHPTMSCTATHQNPIFMMVKKGSVIQGL